jgi:hypothetical protein
VKQRRVIWPHHHGDSPHYLRSSPICVRSNRYIDQLMALTGFIRPLELLSKQPSGKQAGLMAFYSGNLLPV